MKKKNRIQFKLNVLKQRGIPVRMRKQVLLSLAKKENMAMTQWKKNEMWSSSCEDSTDDNVGDVATAPRGRLHKVIEADAGLDYHMQSREL